MLASMLGKLASHPRSPTLAGRRWRHSGTPARTELPRREAGRQRRHASPRVYVTTTSAARKPIGGLRRRRSAFDCWRSCSAPPWPPIHFLPNHPPHLRLRRRVLLRIPLARRTTEALLGGEKSGEAGEAGHYTCSFKFLTTPAANLATSSHPLASLRASLASPSSELHRSCTARRLSERSRARRSRRATYS